MNILTIRKVVFSHLQKYPYTGVVSRNICVSVLLPKKGELWSHYSSYFLAYLDKKYPFLLHIIVKYFLLVQATASSIYLLQAYQLDL